MPGIGDGRQNQMACGESYVLGHHHKNTTIKGDQRIKFYFNIYSLAGLLNYHPYYEQQASNCI